MMSYAEFKRTEVFKAAKVIKLVDEDGVEFSDKISEKELDVMDVQGYCVIDEHLTIALGESIEEFEYIEESDL